MSFAGNGRKKSAKEIPLHFITLTFLCGAALKRAKLHATAAELMRLLKKVGRVVATAREQEGRTPHGAA